MNEPHATIRVVLAEDHPVARTGLRVLLAHQPDIEVVGEAGNGGEARFRRSAGRCYLFPIQATYMVTPIGAEGEKN